MMEFVIFTLFPDMFQGILNESIIRRALDSGAVSIRIVNFRDYATDRHHTVDDYPFGGGAGMLLKPEPLFLAVEAVTHVDVDRSRPFVTLMSPQGRPFSQAIAQDYAKRERIFLVCGHYEGFDERIRSDLADDELSLGDFVLTGGEIAAMAVVDSVVRLLPGVLGNHGSAEDDSFSAGLLEYPQYTRPAEFRGHAVPATLLSGHHENVAAWRRRQALFRTWVRRPDLLPKTSLSAKELGLIARWERGDFHDVEMGRADLRFLQDGRTSVEPPGDDS